MVKTAIPDNAKVRLNYSESAIAVDIAAPRLSEAQWQQLAVKINKARKLVARSKYKLAEDILRDALILAPDYHDTLCYLAIAIAGGKRWYMSAEKIARKLIQSYPNNAAGYFALGRVYLFAGRRGPAFQNFAKAKSLLPRRHHMKIEMEKLDPRRPPVLGLLSRNHPVNILLGQFRFFLLSGHNLLWMGLGLLVLIALIIVLNLI